MTIFLVLGSRFVPSVGRSMEENPDMNHNEIASRVIMEVLSVFAEGRDPFDSVKHSTNAISLKGDFDTTSPTPMEIEEQIDPDIADNSIEGCPVPSLPPLSSSSTPLELSVSYLLRCYMNVATEERQNPKKNCIPLLIDLSNIIVQHLNLILGGRIVCDSPNFMSPLTPYILAGTIPRGLLAEMASQTYQDEALFSDTFTPILRGIMEAMQNASVAEQEHVRPLTALKDLAEIRCGPSHSVRPVGRLIASLGNFHPEPCTPAPGREIAKISFMGPFFSVSLFAEENPKLAVKIFNGTTLPTDRSLVYALQQDIENAHNILHSVCLALLYSPARIPLLEYFSALLKHNEKRVQLQSEEKTLAGTLLTLFV
jgi:ubiquitin conjugation factor E4 B